MGAADTEKVLSSSCEHLCHNWHLVKQQRTSSENLRHNDVAWAEGATTLLPRSNKQEMYHLVRQIVLRTGSGLQPLLLKPLLSEGLSDDLFHTGCKDFLNNGGQSEWIQVSTHSLDDAYLFTFDRPRGEYDPEFERDD